MNRLRFLTISLLLGWLVLSIALFILASRVSYVFWFLFPEMLPWQQASFRAVEGWKFTVDMLRALGGVGLFSLAAVFTGAAFFKWRQISLHHILSAFALGEILLSLLFLALLTLVGLKPEQTALLLAACALPGTLRLGNSLWKSLFSHQRSGLSAFPSVSIRFLSVLAFLFVLGLASARLGYDAAAYYFSHARLMAITGKAVFTYPSDSFVVSSFHPGFLFTVVIQLFGDQAARMLSWVNGGVMLLAGWQIGKTVGLSARARWFFLTFMLTSTAFVDLLGDGKVELISTAPLIVALGWIIDSLQAPSRGRFLLIGALLGFSIIARPYNIFLVPVFTVSFYVLQVWPVLRRQGWNAAFRFARPVLWMFPTLLFMGVFHLWQNALWLGSPFAPLTYARELDSSDWQWQFDPGSLNLLRLLYPFTVTFLNTPQSLGNISPLFVGFLPFLLLPDVRTRLRLSAPFRLLLFSALLTLVLWITLFFTVVEIRYIFFLWILLFLFSGQVLEATLDTLESRSQAVVRVALSLLLVFISLRTLFISLATYSPIDSQGRANCYTIHFCAFLDPLNQSAPEGARVFILNAYRYYLRPDLFACSSQADEYAPLQALAKGNTGMFWAELYRQGFRYITYEETFAEFHSHFGAIPSPDSAPEWLNITVISSTIHEKVYQLQPVHPPFLPLKTCAQTEDGIWRVIAK